MKNVWLMGGFGNVLFQILGYKILLKKGYEDIFFVTSLTERNFITKNINWSIHQKLYHDLISDSQIKKVNSFYMLFAILFAFLSKFTGIYFSFSSFYLNKRSVDNSPIAKNIFGYFQEKAFLKYNQTELLDFASEIKSKYKLVKSYGTVVHYRKGDSHWAIKYGNYYKSVKEMLKKEKDNDIYVVTDSVDDAKIFFSDVENIIIMNSSNAIDDFRIMVSSEKLYCAPSTFSWWAAHTLDENSVVIVPKFLDSELGMFVKGKCIII